VRLRAKGGGNPDNFKRQKKIALSPTLEGREKAFPFSKGEKGLGKDNGEIGHNIIHTKSENGGDRGKTF